MIPSFSKFFAWSLTAHLNCITMFILLHATLMSHHLLYHSAAFACSKWLIFSNSLRCTFFRELGVISDFLCRLFTLSFLHFFSLSSFRVSLGILSSSLLGILPSLILPSLVSLIRFVPPSLLSFLLDTLTSCPLCLSSVESAWTYCSARSPEFYLFSVFLSHYFPRFIFLLLFPVRSVSFPSLLLLLSCSAESSLWHIAQLAPSVLLSSTSPPPTSLFLPLICPLLLLFFAVSLGILSGSLHLSFCSYFFPRLFPLIPHFLLLLRLNAVLPY